MPRRDLAIECTRYAHYYPQDLWTTRSGARARPRGKPRLARFSRGAPGFLRDSRVTPPGAFARMDDHQPLFMNKAEMHAAPPQVVERESAPARGAATFSINLGQSRICWVVDVDDADPPFTGLHIHEAPVGSPGSIIIPLTTPDASGHSEGCRSEDSALLKAIMRTPADYYVNAHNTTCPAGVARGQLSK